MEIDLRSDPAKYSLFVTMYSVLQMRAYVCVAVWCVGVLRYVDWFTILNCKSSTNDVFEVLVQ